MSKEICEAVNQALEKAAIAFSTLYTGQQKRDEWDCDGWRCTFEKKTRSNPAKPYEKETFEFYTGLGHRKENPVTVRQLLREGYKKHLHSAKFEAASKPQAPDAASVIYSLVMDADAVGQSFGSWASEYGYDTDSRKAYATYEACQKNTDKLRRIFTHAQIEELRELLQDF